jgi:hypothetical protein
MFDDPHTPQFPSPAPLGPGVGDVGFEGQLRGAWGLCGSHCLQAACGFTSREEACRARSDERSARREKDA